MCIDYNASVVTKETKPKKGNTHIHPILYLLVCHWLKPSAVSSTRTAIIRDVAFRAASRPSENGHSPVAGDKVHQLGELRVGGGGGWGGYCWWWVGLAAQQLRGYEGAIAGDAVLRVGCMPIWTSRLQTMASTPARMVDDCVCCSISLSRASSGLPWCFPSIDGALGVPQVALMLLCTYIIAMLTQFVWMQLWPPRLL